MNNFWFLILFAICIVALLCGVLWTSGLAWWIAVVVLVVAALVCSFLFLMARIGSGRADASDARRMGWWAVVLWAASVTVGVWL